MNKILAKIILIADRMDVEARQRLYEKGYWVTKELNVIHVKDIDNQHLMNIAKYLYRQASNQLSRSVSIGYSALGTLHGEMAIESVESELMYLEEVMPEDIMSDHPFYPHLYEELSSRKLEVNYG